MTPCPKPSLCSLPWFTELQVASLKANQIENIRAD